MGASLALLVWGLSQGDALAKYITGNSIAESARGALVTSMAVSALVFGALGFALSLRLGLDWLDRWSARLAPLLYVGLIPPLCEYRAWEGRDITFLLLVLIFSCGTADAIARALSSISESTLGRWKIWSRTCWATRGGRLAPLALVVASSVAYACYFSVSTINNHHNFGTSAFDLGIEHNLLWNTAHGGPLFRSSPLGGSMMHGGHHQTYFAFLLAPFYLLVPRAETLLVIQSVFLGAAAIPLFLFAKIKIGEVFAAILAVSFLLYSPMHGANLYDFHYQPFGVFFILLIAYLFERGSSWTVLLPLVLVCLSIREDVGAMLGALGAFMLLMGRRPKDAAIICGTGFAYFIVQKMYVMPVFFLDGKSSFAFMYKLLLPEGEETFGAVLKTAAGNPAYTLDTVFTEEKLAYVLQLFVPVCLLPLRKQAALVLFVPASVFTLLSTKYPALIMTSFQYTAYWTPMIFLAAVMTLSSKRARSGSTAVAAWTVGIVLATLVTSLRYGGVFQVEMARGAYDPVHLRETAEGERMRADFKALAARIPPNAKIAASEWIVSHLAGRRDAYNLRNGFVDAEFILFWLHPTKFRADERPILQQALVQSPKYEVIDRKGMFVLAKRASNPKPIDRDLKREIATAGTPRARKDFKRE